MRFTFHPETFESSWHHPNDLTYHSLQSPEVD